MDDSMTYEEYKKWLDVKTSLEASGKTDSIFYEEAMNRLYRRPVPPYPKADVPITKNDQF
jgi:hypothetical protein